jgi:hypothetical protein
MVALGLAVSTAGTLSPAKALGSYDSKLELGSGIALAVFGGVVFVPTAIALMDPPLTAQRIVGRSLVMAGALTAIAFSVYFFADDDPLWIPHALGWGIGGALATTGFIVWLTDDTGEPASDVTSAEGSTSAGPGAEGPAAAPAAPADVPAAAPVVGLLGLAPLALPGGGGFLVAGTW